MLSDKQRLPIGLISFICSIMSRRISGARDKALVVRFNCELVIWAVIFNHSFVLCKPKCYITKNYNNNPNVGDVDTINQTLWSIVVFLCAFIFLFSLESGLHLFVYIPQNYIVLIIFFGDSLWKFMCQSLRLEESFGLQCITPLYFHWY